MSLIDLQGTRRFENFGTGARRTASGGALTSTISAGLIGKEVVKNMYGNPRNIKETPGINTAEALSRDFKNNPAMGASGQLTLSLSKFGY